MDNVHDQISDLIEDHACGELELPSNLEALMADKGNQQRLYLLLRTAELLTEVPLLNTGRVEFLTAIQSLTKKSNKII